MEEDTVRYAIHDLIHRKERRIREIEEANKTELRALSRIHNDVTIAAIEHSISTLIQLEHNLKLCGCPPEAYQDKKERSRHVSLLTTSSQ